MLIKTSAGGCSTHQARLLLEALPPWLLQGALSASELPLVARTATETAATPCLLAVPPAAREAKGGGRCTDLTVKVQVTATTAFHWDLMEARHHLDDTACSIATTAQGSCQAHSTSGRSVWCSHHLAIAVLRRLESSHPAGALAS